MKKSASNTAMALAVFGLVELVRYLSLGYGLSGRPGARTMMTIGGGLRGSKPASSGQLGGLVADVISVVAGPVDIVTASTSKAPPPKPKPAPQPKPAPPPPPAPPPTPLPPPGPPSVNAPIVPQSKCANGQVGVQIALPILNAKDTCISNDPKSGGAIVAYTKLALKMMGGLVGTVIMLMLVISGIQYITSLGDPGRIKNAKTRITNAVIALVLFLMMYAILNFLVPGGIL